MEADLLSRLAKSVDMTDKLLRLAVLVVGGLVAGAIWCTTISYRLSAIETDRQSRIPGVDAWRRQVDIDNAKRDSLLQQYGQTVIDHSARLRQIEEEWQRRRP